MAVNDIRDTLQDRDKTEKLLGFAIQKLMQKYTVEWASDRNKDQILQILETALNSFYFQAINTIYKYAESEIEKIFLNSFVMCFLFGDPLRLRLEAPYDDGNKDIQDIRKYLKIMLDADKKALEETGEKDGWFQYIDHLLAAGEVSKDEHNRYFNDYIINHKVGYYHAFYVTLQTNFPDIIIEGKSIRPDIYIWKPSDENFNLIVECDGFQFHSGKDSFITDRKRDRYLRTLGFEVMRYSGSEIYNDPVKTGKELFEYLQKFRT